MVVKNESALFTDQVKANGHKVHFCRRCGKHCYSEDALENHMRYCEHHDYIKVTYPEPGEISLSLKTGKKLSELQ